jgi:membrane-associated phospholipid phosphatase
MIKNDSILSFRSPKGYIPSLAYNFGHQFTSPLRMNVKDVCWFAGAAIITAFLIHNDYSIDESIRYSKDDNSIVKKASPMITEFGNTYGIGVVGICGIAGLITKDRNLLQTSLLATQAAITSGIWVRIVKYCTSRERPSASYTSDANKGHPGGHWYGFFKQYDVSVTSVGRDISFFDAFPSGHTSTAFSIATVFAMQYSETKVVPIVAYTLAALVGITRMTEHTHWASDVFVGAWAGYLCAKQVVRHNRKLFAGDSLYSSGKKKSYDMFFSVADNSAGLKMKMIF